MKRVLTLIILFAGLRLSAAIPSRGIDTPKTPVLHHKPDTFKLLAAATNTDSAKIKQPVNKQDSLSKITIILPKDTADLAEPVYVDNNPPVTSLLQLDSLKAEEIAEQAHQARLKQLLLQYEKAKFAELLKINNLDSLKQQLKVTTSDTLKALLYTRIALKYLDYDTIANLEKQQHYQNAALNYTLLAIRKYSVYNDSTGLRTSYFNLAKVYFAQRQYTQAKWFILQSNAIARAQNDVPDIISTLLMLASVKSEIQDYTLAMSDLDEALQLSITSHSPKTELDVLEEYAQLYNALANFPKVTAVLQRRDALLDSIKKSDEALAAKTAAQKKKLDLLNKKKLLLASTRKTTKNASPAKMASL